MNVLQTVIACIGRVCLGAVFLLSSICDIMDWEGVNHHLLIALAKWTNLYLGDVWISMVLEKMISYSSMVMVGAVAVKMLGSLMIMLGVRIRFGAFLLILFLVPTTFLLHDFWHLEGAMRELELVMFLKNLSIFGGLALVLAYGKGICKKALPEVE